MDAEAGERFRTFGVERDGLDAAHDHARGLDRRTQLEATDIVEARLQMIARRPVQRKQISHLQRQKKDRAKPDGDENADPEIDRRTIHEPIPLNMNTVNTKSSARIASEDTTTVRVFTLETPSAVGFAS